MTSDGILTIYDLTDIAEAGAMPAQKLAAVVTAFYSRRTVGVTRLYAASSANRRIDMLVRCHNTVPSESYKYVILEDGSQYRIDAAQEIVGEDALDLTLVRLEDYYDVAEES